MNRKPDKKRSDGSRRRSSRRASRRGSRPFYRTVALPAAAGGTGESLEGSDEVIAVIRSLMADLLKGRPDALPLFLRSNDSLVRAIAAEYRRARKSSRELAGNFWAVLDHLGEQFGQPPGLLPPEGG